MRTLYKVFLLLISAMLFTGCFKKNVTKDDADDIEEIIIANSGGEKILVSKESIFQATSKSSKGGIRTTTGYSEYRLSSYNLNTGELLKRIELGERDDDYLYFLGNTDGKLWYYSQNEKLGLHARDPKTLDIVVSQDQILNVNPFLKGNFPKVKWYELRRYFGYDYTKSIPIVSDNSGIIYSLDPTTLKAEKRTGSMTNYKYEESTQSTSMNIDKDLHVSLSGDPRKHLRIGNKNFEELDFLKGEFLFSSGVIPAKDIYPDYFAPILKEIEKKQRAIDSLNTLIEEQKDETDVWKARMVERMRDRVKHEQRDLENENSKLTKASDEKINIVISRDKGFFVIHSTTASDTAKVLITKIRFNVEDKSPSSLWTTLLPNIFYDPDKVYEKGSFDYVFSKGSPNLRTKRVLYSDDKLVFITMLKAVCIDMNTGSILWERFM
jgi:hypothetical protein